MNFILIIPFKAQGAAVATTISQFIVAFIQMNYIKREINIKSILKSSKNYFVASLTMFAICMLVGLVINNVILSIAVKVFVGIIVYFIMLVIFRDKYIYEARDIIISKIKKR